MKNLLIALGVLACLAVVGLGGLGALWWFVWRVNVDEVAVPRKQAEEIRKAPDVEVKAGDWPWWRGPTRNGIATGDLPPTEWNSQKNIVWQTRVPGEGHASPIVVGKRVILAAANRDDQTMSLLCYDRETGDRLWNRELHRGGFMSIHSTNSHASPTPACDGERIFAAFMVDSGLWVSAVSLEGETLWQKNIGEFSARHGYGSSPVIYKTLVIVSGDGNGPSYLAALDRKTGEVIWRKQRFRGDSYSTPIVAEVGGRPQLLLNGQHRVASYDPASGELLWKCKGPARTTANTMVFNSDLVFASGGYPQKQILCINADGQVQWEDNQKVYVPSMLVVNDLLFAVTDNGFAICYDAGTGERKWRQRFQGEFWSSPTLIEDRIYAINKQGKTFIFKASADFEMIAQNDLGEGCLASPVICDGRIYQRTARALYCIGKK